MRGTSKLDYTQLQRLARIGKVLQELYNLSTEYVYIRLHTVVALNNKTSTVMISPVKVFEKVQAH